MTRKVTQNVDQVVNFVKCCKSELDDYLLNLADSETNHNVGSDDGEVSNLLSTEDDVNCC